MVNVSYFLYFNVTLYFNATNLFVYVLLEEMLDIDMPEERQSDWDKVFFY